jgi:hypothetical protein
MQTCDLVKLLKGFKICILELIVSLSEKILRASTLGSNTLSLPESMKVLRLFLEQLVIELPNMLLNLQDKTIENRLLECIKLAL